MSFGPAHSLSVRFTAITSSTFANETPDSRLTMSPGRRTGV